MKKYNEFNYQINEGFISNVIKKIINFFRMKFGNKAYAYIALFLKKKNKIPKDVLIRVPKSWDNNSDLKDAEKEFGEIGTEDNKNESLNESKLTESLKDEKFNLMVIRPDSFTINESSKYRREDYDPSDYIDMDSVTLDNYDVKKLKDKIKLYYKMAMGGDRLSLFIWGAPGIGKTAVTQQLAEELNLMVQVWTLATLESADLKGVPTLRDLTPDPNMPEKLKKQMMKDLKSNNFEYTETINALPMLLPGDNWNTNNHNGGILFFDEINRAIPEVLDASLSLTLDGTMDQYKLPSEWLVIAAGNRVSDIQGGNIRELETAILNRFAHINFAPKFEDWLDYITPKSFMNSDIIDFLKKDENHEKTLSDGRPAYYYKLMSNFAKVNTTANAAPTPRAWENASRKHYAAANFVSGKFDQEIGNWDGMTDIPESIIGKDWDWSHRYDVPDEILLGIYKGSVGHEAANEFMDFQSEQAEAYAEEMAEKRRLEKMKNKKDTEKVSNENKKTNN